PRECFVHHHDWRRAWAVGAREIPAIAQRDSKHIEVGRRRGDDFGLRLPSARVVLERDRERPASVQRRAAGKTRGTNAWQRSERVENLTRQRCLTGRVARGSRDVDRYKRDAVGAKPEVDTEQIVERAREQRRTRDEYE